MKGHSKRVGTQLVMQQYDGVVQRTGQIAQGLLGNVEVVGKNVAKCSLAPVVVRPIDGGPEFKQIRDGQAGEQSVEAIPKTAIAKYLNPVGASHR